MIRLRGVPPESTGLMLDVHNDILEIAKVLLRERDFVICEEALVRAKRLQYRKSIQWPAIKEELQAEFQCQLLSISRTQFREQIDSKYKPLPVLVHVRDYLRKGNGNETAGYSFANWDHAITQRKIAARRHTATGFDKSADRLQIEMEQAAQFEQLAKDNEQL